MLHNKSAGSYQTISQGKIPEEISVSENRWSSFSAFGFESGSSIVIEIDDYSKKVVVSRIGRIHQTAVERK